MKIRKKFNQAEFNRIYKGTLPFCETKYFDKFLELLEDEKALEHIKFANDILEIPPVKSMINLYRDFFSEEMTSQEKQGLGACFGYLYRFIYEGYVAEQVWVGDKEFTGIKTASVFRKIK
jgi:hypothetical protein